MLDSTKLHETHCHCCTKAATRGKGNTPCPARLPDDLGWAKEATKRLLGSRRKNIELCGALGERNKKESI